jgi:hypothetical protein
MRNRIIAILSVVALLLVSLSFTLPGNAKKSSTAHNETTSTHGPAGGLGIEEK